MAIQNDSQVQWFVVYHNDPDTEQPFEEKGIPNHKNKNIKFIIREGTDGTQRFYVPKLDGWMRVPEERAEKQLPYISQQQLKNAYYKIKN